MVLLPLQLQSLPLAHAAEGFIVSQDGPFDEYNFPQLPTDYDIVQMSFGIEQEYPDDYDFFINFVDPIRSSQFDGTDGSFAMVMLDLDNDGEEDFSLDTTDESYDGNEYHLAALVDRRNGKADTISDCEVSTWTNLDAKVTWIAFQIPQSCLPFERTFGIMGYAGSDIGEKNWDLSSEEFWVINPTQNDEAAPSVGGTSATDLPTLTSDRLSAIANPANPPGDLSDLSREISDSVVTIFCADDSGSGWSAKVELTSDLKSEGIKSYVITNHHVIEGCTDGQEIEIILANGDSVAGRVFAWDLDNDLAGIITAEAIPAVTWVGPAPEQGWWVGVMGSPLGQPGILTTGIASSAPDNYKGFMSAPINPGNSGGPVFDNFGRVIGVATAIKIIPKSGADNYDLSQGFNIYGGTPLLCSAVVNCSAGDIWVGASGSLAPGGTLVIVLVLLALIGVVVFVVVNSQRRKIPTYASPFTSQSTFGTPAQFPGYTQPNSESRPSTQNRPGNIPPPPGSIPPPPGGR
jgi:hypothetical protein